MQPINPAIRLYATSARKAPTVGRCVVGWFNGWSVGQILPLRLLLIRDIGALCG